MCLRGNNDISMWQIIFSKDVHGILRSTCSYKCDLDTPPIKR